MLSTSAVLVIQLAAWGLPLLLTVGGYLTYKIKKNQAELEKLSNDFSDDLVKIYDKYNAIVGISKNASLIVDRQKKELELMISSISKLHQYLDEIKKSKKDLVSTRIYKLIEELNRFNNGAIQSIVQNNTETIHNLTSPEDFQKFLEQLKQQILNINNEGTAHINSELDQEKNQIIAIIEKQQIEINKDVEQSKKKNINTIEDIVSDLKKQSSYFDNICRTLKKEINNNKDLQEKYKYFISSNLMSKNSLDIFKEMEEDISRYENGKQMLDNLIKAYETPEQLSQKHENHFLKNLENSIKFFESENQTLTENISDLEKQTNQLNIDKETCLIDILNTNLKFAIDVENIKLPASTVDTNINTWVKKTGKDILEKQIDINKNINKYYENVLRDMTQIVWKNLDHNRPTKLHHKIYHFFKNKFTDQQNQYDPDKYIKLMNTRIKNKIEDENNEGIDTTTNIKNINTLNNALNATKNSSNNKATYNELARDQEILYLLKYAEQYHQDMNTIKKGRKKGFFVKTNEIYALLDYCNTAVPQEMIYADINYKYAKKYEEIAYDVKNNTQNFMMMYLISKLMKHPNVNIDILKKNKNKSVYYLSTILQKYGDQIYQNQNIQKMISVIFKFHFMIVRQQGNSNIQKIEKIGKVYDLWLAQDNSKENNKNDFTHFDPNECINIINELYQFDVTTPKNISFMDDLDKMTNETKNTGYLISNFVSKLPIK